MKKKQTPSAFSRLMEYAGRFRVLTYRMRTVSGADKIVVLSDGTVAEEGKPQELLARQGSAFRRMAELQTESANWSI